MNTIIKWVMISGLFYLISLFFVNSTFKLADYEWMLQSTTNSILQDSILNKGYKPRRMVFESTPFPFVFDWSTGSFCNDGVGRCCLIPSGNFKPVWPFYINCMACEPFTKDMTSNEGGCGDILTDLLLKSNKLKFIMNDSINIFAKGFQLNYKGKRKY